MIKKNINSSANTGNKNKHLPLKSIMTFFCIVMFTVMTLLSQLYVILDSNIVTRNDIILFTVDVINTGILENIAFALFYSVIAYCAVVYSTKKLIAVCGIYLGFSLLRRTALVLLTYITFREFDWINPLIYLAIEAIQMLLVALISVSIGKSHQEAVESKQKAAIRMGSLYLEDSLEFNSVFSTQNPLQVCALISGIMLSVINVGMRIGSDITYTMVHGAPEGVSEIILMAAYYLSDILVCVLVYAVSWLILKIFTQKDNSIRRTN